MLKLLDKLPLLPLVVLSLTLGLAPFLPQPHLIEKLGMLLSGELSKLTDVFDLLMHGAGPTLLIAKLVRMWRGKSAAD